MRTRAVRSSMLGCIGAVVVAIGVAVILRLNAVSHPIDDGYTVVVSEKARIRSAGVAKGEQAYTCKADAEACARAAVQEICGDDEYEITFRSVEVGTDGTGFDGEWAYRCFKRHSVL